MSRFDINYDRLLKQLLPETMRRLLIFRWLRTLIMPVIFIYDLFRAHRNVKLYEINHTGQVISLQAVLNDAFDTMLRRIEIIDDVNRDPIYIRTNAENEPIYLSTVAENAPVYLYTNAEGEGGWYDFIIKVPIGTMFNVARMQALINKYRLPSMCNYLIKTV